ncbi:MAG TPA: CehA/McbA family metallohydrolase [Steroidobacteraceae bacterium]
MICRVEPIGRAAMMIVAVAALLVARGAGAAVRVVVGPTPIPGGQARAAGDITLMNDRLAVAIAVQTAPPWAIPRGALIDAAPVVDGRIGRDHLTFADFLPNGWSAWPSTYQHVHVITDTPTLGVVRAVRNWNAVMIETTYSLKSGEDSVHMVVRMTNEGTKPVVNALSGLVLWPSGGYFFGVPGMAHTVTGSAAGAMSDRIEGYDSSWLIALHEPVFDRFDYGQRDLYLLHTLQPGQRRTFEGWLQVLGRGDMAPVVEAEITRRALAAGTVSGAVTDTAGHPVASPVVIVEKAGVPFAWTAGRDGRYAIELPAGDYALYATAAGYSDSARARLTVRRNDAVRRDFAGLEPPGHLEIDVNDGAGGAPLDARIDIEKGQKPVVEYLGKHTFFTGLAPKGRARITLAPGSYVLSVGSGAGFLAEPRDIPVTIAPGKSQSLQVAIERLFDPGEAGWYSADMHHHSDQEDGVTPPQDVARSELAAGLDVLFLSDHDTTVNDGIMRAIARKRGVPFIPSIELSPSWGHFNAYPVIPGAPMTLGLSKASVQEVFGEAHRLGAQFIEVNHPYDPGEGYFGSLERGVARGGFDGDFDFLEINGSQPENDGKTLASAWKFWNEGKRYYLAAGSDTHDVWNDHSGDARVYVHVDGRLTTASFLAGLKAGHAYVTHGPLIVPDHMFGSQVESGTTLGFTLEAAAGLARVTVIADGKPHETVDYHGERTVRLTLPATGGWDALTVEDRAGKTAYTDPIWVRPLP